MKKREIVLVILLIISIFLCFYFDSTLVKYVSYLRNKILDNFFLLITFVSSEIIIFFVLTTLFLIKKKRRKWIFPLWISLGLSTIVSFVLKTTIRRARPFQIGIVELISNLQSSSYSTWNFSFPSFQSMMVFSALPILNKGFPKLKNFWTICAVLVAFSRVYFGVHFFSDVLIGGAVGYLIGTVVVKLWDKSFLKKQRIKTKNHKKISRKN